MRVAGADLPATASWAADVDFGAADWLRDVLTTTVLPGDFELEGLDLVATMGFSGRFTGGDLAGEVFATVLGADFGVDLGDAFEDTTVLGAGAPAAEAFGLVAAAGEIFGLDLETAGAGAVLGAVLGAGITYDPRGTLP